MAEPCITQALYYALSVALIAGILTGIALMGKVRSAAWGNLLSAFSTVAAIILTMLYFNVLSLAEVWVCLAIGALIGVIGAYRAKMIQMPQIVALLNGIGGAASAFVAAVVLYGGLETGAFSQFTAAIALYVGVFTLTGSLVAAGKLVGTLTQKPVVWKIHQPLILINFALMAIFLCVLFLTDISTPVSLWVLLPMFALSNNLGVAVAVRVGGADMPITISLLNSLTGVAMSMMGMAVSDPLLVAVGGIIGAAGLILTQIMCRAMNRSLMEILMGKTSTAAPVAVDEKTEAVPIPETETQEATEAEEPPNLDYTQILAEAKNVIIVPGYGMALAQAQELVKQLADKLEAGGADVKYAIHPVAGRMPGHMNVLLAEVDVPYDKLFEIDEINPLFDDCDVAIVIGANDVINPAANTATDTPIYGMPVLDVEKAKHIIICNYDTQPGYSGVPNPLYEKNRAILLLGDAKDSLEKLI
jgi:NAD(P) transhydrogenase subunit beta